MRYREQQDKLRPAIPYLYLYDKDGAQAFTDVGQFHAWDMTKIKTTHFQYTSDTNKIFLGVNASGYYLIEFDCSFVSYINGWVQIISSVYKNGTQIEGTESYCSVYAAEQSPISYVCQTIHAVIYLEKGDSIKIHTITNNAGNVYNLPKTSRLIIHRISMKGWDNNAGGLEIYSGGIAR